MTSTDLPAGQLRVRNARSNLQRYGSLVVLLLLLGYNALFTPNFLTLQTLNVNLTQVATTIIVAVGMTLVIATGGIDLSVGSLMAIAGTLAPLIFLQTVPPFNDPLVGTLAAYVIPIVATALLGLFNGYLVAFVQIQPIIATLILYIAGRGVAQVMTNGYLQSFQNPSFQFIGLGRVAGVPTQVILMVLVVAVAAWVVQRTVFGRYVLAIGGNEAAARLAGAPVARVKLIVYAVSGALAGLAGLIVIAINSAADANLVGQNMELDAIAAVAVGGTSLTGGRAAIVGTLLGALIIQLIRFTLLSNGVPFAVAQIINACIILAAVALQHRSR